MARKFLYIVAGLIVLVLAAMFAMRIWWQELSQFVYVPKVAFEQQAPLAANIYDDPAMWISRPGKGAADPAHWRPEGFVADPAPSRAAVFFIHPTSYLAKAHWNAPLDDAESRNRAEVFVRGLASPFNQTPDLWVPRYRQAAFGAFLTDAPDGRRAIDAAYADVAQAFDYFVQTVDKDAPIILAGHSQGALHLKRLLAERIAGRPIAQRVVAAYVIGWPVSLEHDLPKMGLDACAGPDQARCVVSWSSFAEPADPAPTLAAYAKSRGLDGQPNGTSAILCTNPLTGGVGGAAPASANLGTLYPDAELKTGKLVAATVPARCGADGMLYIGPPPEMGPYVLPGNNYHVYDIALFWQNLRADVKRRQAAWDRTR